MGQQQLLLIILGMALIGIALAVGLGMFSDNSIQANKDAMIHDILNIFASGAYHHYLRPGSMGGGGYTFDGSKPGTTPYKISSRLATNSYAVYDVTNTETTCTITGTSTTYPGNSVSCTIGTEGKPVGPWVIDGPDFK